MSKMTKAQAGALGARKRWGPRRRIDLRTVDPITAEVIRRLLAADENLKRREAAEPSEAA